jgi:hypothetical protein
MKRDLQREGYNIKSLGPDEDLFFMGPNDKEYRKLDHALYNDIINNVSVAKL